jgi:hypothetical protein
MTQIQARAAMGAHLRVQGGEGEDHDTGYIIDVEGDMATVAWDSGVRTPCPISDLRVAE